MTGNLLAVFLLLASPALAWQDSIEQSFSVSPGDRLLVRAERGSIEVAAGEGNEAFIEIIPRNGDVAQLREDFDIRFDQSGRDVIVEVDARGEWKGWFNWGSRRGFRIKAFVPRQFDVDLKTSGGSISVDDLQGDVRAETSGGSLSFGRIEGPVWGRTSGGSISLEQSVGEADIETSGGSITIGDVDGPVRANTSGGSIRIEQARGDVEAKTSGGSISVDEVLGSIEAHTSGGSINATIATQPRGKCSLTTSGGNVIVRLAGGLNFDLDARASGGRVRSEFDVTGRGRVNKRELRGQLNAGGPTLRLRTSGGTIKVERLNRMR